MGRFQIGFYSHRPPFFAGETIKGYLDVRFDQPVRLRGIYMTFYGRAKIEWKTGAGQKRRTHFAAEEYVEEKRVLYGTAPKDKSPREVHPAGCYRYDFEVTIPKDAPPSHKTRFGDIKYSFKVKLEGQPTFMNDTGDKIEVSVKNITEVPAIGSVQEPVELRKNKNLCCMCCTSGPITGLIRIDKSACLPGDSIMVNAQVYNYSTRTCNSTSIRLVQEILFKAFDGAKERDRHVLHKTEHSNPLHPGETDAFENVLVTIPYHVMPSMKRCKIIRLKHSIKLVVCPKKALDLDVPLDITIGTPWSVTGDLVRPEASQYSYDGQRSAVDVTSDAMQIYRHTVTLQNHFQANQTGQLQDGRQPDSQSGPEDIRPEFHSSSPQSDRPQSYQTRPEDIHPSVGQVGPQHEPRTNDQERSQDERRAYYQTRAQDEHRAYNETRSQDERRAYDQTRSQDERRAYDQTRSQDERRAYDQTRSQDERRAYNQTRSQDGHMAYGHGRLSPNSHMPYNQRSAYGDRRSYDQSGQQNKRDSHKQGSLSDDRRTYDEARPHSENGSTNHRTSHDVHRTYYQAREQDQRETHEQRPTTDDHRPSNQRPSYDDPRTGDQTRSHHERAIYNQRSTNDDPRVYHAKPPDQRRASNERPSHDDRNTYDRARPQDERRTYNQRNYQDDNVLHLDQTPPVYHSEETLRSATTDSSLV